MDVLHRSAKLLHLLIGAITGSLVFACSNSEGNDATGTEIIAAVESNSHDIEYASPSQETSSAKTFDYIPIDDSEYPYAGIPRIVIETENHREIKDRETEIPARLQIWGEKAPESEIMDLTIRGRGNTSWTNMPKKSYKIEFVDKQAMLGMPKDRDWALIANYADKTLMKNYLAYHLSAELGAYYAPRCEFVELYLNKDYLGVYLLTETIKIAKKRISIPNNENSYIVEIDKRTRDGEQKIYSNMISNENPGKGFQIHYPQNASTQKLDSIRNRIQSLELFIRSIQANKNNNVSKWIDINEYIKHYWVQELSKNCDANFYSSVYFSWSNDSPLKMGPVWDFDLAFGGHDDINCSHPHEWLLKSSYWNEYLFRDSIVNHTRKKFWHANRESISAIISKINSTEILLNSAAANNFKRWDILQSTKFRYHLYSYSSYLETADNLKDWLNERITWIDSHLD